MAEFERENRYIVIKRSDLDAMTRTQAEIDELDHILYAIESHRRIGLKKQPLNCVVVERDWPEYEPVWEMIQSRMEGRTPDLLAEKETHAICCLGGDHKCQLNVNGGCCAATRCQYRVFSQYQKAKG